MTTIEPETTSKESAPKNSLVPLDIDFGDTWDSAALRALIDERIAAERSPSWIFLGKHESLLLRAHLASAFGHEEVQSLHRVYYLGLEVIELEAPRFCRLAGRKFMSKLESHNADLRKWKEDDFSNWQFRFE